MAKTNPNNFVELLIAALKKRGVELPNIPATKGREAYLKFLSFMGYREEELLPVVDHERVTGEMHGATFLALMKALESNDPKLLKAIGWIAVNAVTGRDNTNIILYELASNLSRDLIDTGYQLPDFYAGVFPTDSFNAQCRVFQSSNLVLVDTGCMEMAEAATITFLSKTSQPSKVKEITDAVEIYVATGKRPNPNYLDASGIKWGSGAVPALVNSFEEYMLAHEIGHLALGHIKVDNIRHHSPRLGQSFDVAAKAQFEEFQADLWACNALIKRAWKKGSDDTEMAIALVGPMMALGMGLLVEGECNKRGIDGRGGHPPTAERLYMVQVLYELLGVHDSAGIAYGFFNLIKEVLESRYTAVEPPPFLDRELNRKLMPILDSLDIKYGEAPYITNFS